MSTIYTGTVPRTPTNVQITAIDQHSFLVSWSAPDMSNCTDIDSYIINCFNYYYGNDYSAEVPSYSLNATIVHDEDINENYYNSGFFECYVRGNNSAGQGSSDYGYGREYYNYNKLYIYC